LDGEFCYLSFSIKLFRNISAETMFNLLLPSLSVPDNKSLNNTDSNIKPKVWVETGQMHQKSDISAVHLDENEVHDEHEVG
jgi:hypothetical protein